MAKRTVTQLEDDIDGGEAAETVTFALDGQEYEIDLNEQNASALRDALAPFTAAGSRTGGRGRGRRGAGGGRSGGASSAGDKQRLSDIRTWARDNGYTVSDRGRIPGKVVEAYDAAH